MLNKKRLAKLTLQLAQTESTMSDARDLLSYLNTTAENLLVIADTQSNGIGRNDNHWLSPKGGLWFTYCVEDSSISSQITLVLGLVLYRVLTNQFPDLKTRLQIKWPNDLILDHKKLSGILVQHHKNFLCMGIGLNTNNEAIDLDTPIPPVSLKQIFDFDVSNSALLVSFLEYFQSIYAQYLSEGLKPFRKEINSLLYGLNSQLEFDNNETIISGMCRGISEDGALVLENKGGELLPYYSGSIIKITD